MGMRERVPVVGCFFIVEKWGLLTARSVQNINRLKKQTRTIMLDIQGELSSIGKYAFYGCPEELVITYSGATYNKDTIENIK